MPDHSLARTVEMRFEEWAALPVHPRQRNTERHARARHWTAAKAADGAVAAVLNHVVAADLDGKLYKVDGHTRTYLWEAGQLPVPETVTVDVYRVRDEAELLRIYNAFDAPTAAERPTDMVWGAYRQHGIEISSGRLRGGLIMPALAIALLGNRYRPATKNPNLRIDPYEAVGLFRHELQILDELCVDRGVFASGVLATALLCLAVHPQEREFWSRLSRREGAKQDGKVDPVEAVLQEIDGMRVAKRGSFGAAQVELAGRTMRGFEAWLHRNEPGNQYWFSNRVRELDLDPYIDAVKTLKGHCNP